MPGDAALGAGTAAESPNAGTAAESPGEAGFLRRINL